MASDYDTQRFIKCCYTTVERSILINMILTPTSLTWEAEKPGPDLEPSDQM